MRAHVLPEVNRKHELRSGQFAEALLDELVYIVADDFHDGRSLEIADVLDVRDDLVTARFGEETHIVTLALVTVIAAQVKDADVFLGRKIGIGQVVFGRDNFGFGNVKLPVLWSVHDNDFFHNVCTCGVFKAKLRRACQKPLCFLTL